MDALPPHPSPLRSGRPTPSPTPGPRYDQRCSRYLGVSDTKPAPKSAKKSQQIGEQNGGPIFRQNRFPVTWIPNTPSFWLLSCWSHVVTQIMSQFSKKIFVSRSVHGP